MAASLGEKLRQARESKGLELRDVAAQTRIALNYLAAIESDDFKTLPGGVFNKGFVRSFARVVGIDEREALADYTNLMAAQGINTADESNLPRRPEVLINNNSGSPFLTLILALFMLGFISAGIYFGVRYLQNRSNSIQETPVASPTPISSANENPVPTPTTQSLAPANNLTVQIKALSETVNVETTVDSRRKEIFNLQPNETKEFTAQQSLRFRYAKTLANQLQITINGRPAITQTTTKNPRSIGVEMDITRENFAQFLQNP